MMYIRITTCPPCGKNLGSPTVKLSQDTKLALANAGLGAPGGNAHWGTTDFSACAIKLEHSSQVQRMVETHPG